MKSTLFPKVDTIILNSKRHNRVEGAVTSRLFRDQPYLLRIPFASDKAQLGVTGEDLLKALVPISGDIEYPDSKSSMCNLNPDCNKRSVTFTTFCP